MALINPVSFTTPGTPSPQALAQGLMPLSEVANNPGQFNTPSMPAIDPSMLMKSEYPAGYKDSAGIPGQTLKDAGIAPGAENYNWLNKGYDWLTGESPNAFSKNGISDADIQGMTYKQGLPSLTKLSDWMK